MLAFACPACGKKLQVADEAAGRDCRCPHCQHMVKAPRDGAETVSQPPLAKPAKTAPWPMIPDYELLEVLGQGGMGMVFRARHLPLDRPVALKVIRPDRLDDGNPAAVRRFLHEVRAAAQLDHPNLIKVFDAGSAGDVHYLSMELIEGDDLAKLVRRDGPLSIERTVRYLRQTADGLSQAHVKAIVHRDIKPHNLLLEPRTDQVKILDLGLARMAGSGVSQSSLTDTGAVMGTLDYMAPEQGLNAKGVDGRADLYSLGCTAYHLLTGQPPFKGETGTAVLLAHQMQPPLPVTERRPEVPAELAAVVARLLAKKPEERYATAAEVIAALDQLTQARQAGRRAAHARLAETQDDVPSGAAPVERGGRGVAQRPPGADAPGSPHRRQQRTPIGVLLLAGVAALLLFAGVLGYALFVSGPAKTRPTDARAQLPLDTALSDPTPTQPPPTTRPAATQAAPPPTGPVKPPPPDPLPKPFEPLPGKEYITNSIGMHFVKIPKGTFLMGAPKEEANSYDEERPQHEVEITQDFYLGVYEVTQEQYFAVMGSNPSSFKGASLPVEYVTWNNADTFCQKLSALEKETEAKRVYRLPTEAEWEYACRGRAGLKNPFNIQGTDGLTLTSDLANFNGNYPYPSTAAKGIYRQKTTPVGTFPPNDMGLYDMHGNVWEWCQDWNGPYKPEMQKDPQGPPTGTLRVLRGGSWIYDGLSCRAADRSRCIPGYRDNFGGFRVVCSPVRTP